MEKCHLCFGLGVYQKEPCILCDGTGEIDDPAEADKKIPGRNLYYEAYLNKHQNLVDDNENFSFKQKEVLRVLLKSGTTIYPYSFDGDWDFTYSDDKVALISQLLDGKWSCDISSTNLNDDVFMLNIIFDKPRPVYDFCYDQYSKDTKITTEKLELYISYSDFLELYKSKLFI